MKKQNKTRLAKKTIFTTFTTVFTLAIFFLGIATFSPKTSVNIWERGYVNAVGFDQVGDEKDPRKYDATVHLVKIARQADIKISTEVVLSIKKVEQKTNTTLTNSKKDFYVTGLIMGVKEDNSFYIAFTPTSTGDTSTYYTVDDLAFVVEKEAGIFGEIVSVLTTLPVFIIVAFTLIVIDYTIYYFSLVRKNEDEYLNSIPEDDVEEDVEEDEVEEVEEDNEIEED